MGSHARGGIAVSTEERTYSSGSRGSRAYWLALRDRWPLLAVAVAAALIAAVVTTQSLQKQYSAEADVQVTPIPSSDDTFIGMGLLQESNESRAVLTVARFVRSHQVADVVARKIGGNPNTLLSEVQAQPQGQSNILTIVAKANSPKRAEQEANTFAQTLIAQKKQRFQQALTTRISNLEHAAAHPRTPGAADGIAQALGILQPYVGKGDPTLDVPNPAVASSTPVSPRAKLLLIVVVLAALLLGCAWIFALELLDPRVREEEQLAETGKPILARLPRIRRRDARQILAGERALPGNVLAAFRLLAERLFARNGGWAAEGKAALITAVPDRARSENLSEAVTVVNLAAVAASAGQQTIIIDADPRHEIANTFNVNGGGPDFADLLAGADHREVVRPVPGSEGRLSIVSVTSNGSTPIGPGGVAVFDLFGKKRLSRAFEQLRAAASVVVVNAPPATDAAELIPFAAPADEVVVEIELGVTGQRQLDELLQTLEQQEIGVTGFVLFTRRRARTVRRATYPRSAPATATASSADLAPVRDRVQPWTQEKQQNLDPNG
jgi:capsular polysaccharide biosynthesis protein